MNEEVQGIRIGSSHNLQHFERKRWVMLEVNFFIQDNLEQDKLIKKCLRTTE